jgi:hypothetical protein
LEKLWLDIAEKEAQYARLHGARQVTPEQVANAHAYTQNRRVNQSLTRVLTDQLPSNRDVSNDETLGGLMSGLRQNIQNDPALTPQERIRHYMEQWERSGRYHNTVDRLLGGLLLPDQVDDAIREILQSGYPTDAQTLRRLWEQRYAQTHRRSTEAEGRY